MRAKCGVAAAASAALAFLISAGFAWGDGSGDPAAVKTQDGKSTDKDGNPTYKIEKDGTVDWYTYSGFIRYHSECHVCHGPNGDGSSFAPALKDSLKTIPYSKFLEVVASGRQNVNTANENVMPAFGANRNVMCFLDDIFIYIRARANDAVPPGRPAKHAEKPKAWEDAENSCMGPN